MNNFFDVNFTILKVAGIWVPSPNSSYRAKFLYFVYNSFWITYSCLIFCPSELAYFINTYTSLKDLIKNVNMGMTHFLANIKVCMWFYYRKDIIGIIETLDIYGKRYESYGDFDNEKIVQKEKKFKDKFSVIFLLFGMLTSISSCMACFYQTLKLKLQEDERVQLSLPYFSYIPFDYEYSKVKFLIAIWYQFFPLFNYAYLIIGFDTLYIAILSYISAQLDIIYGAFETIRPRCMIRLKLDLPKNILKDPPMLMKEMHKEINKITYHLQVILDICRRLEDIYSTIILAQVLISLIVLCTCIFLVSLMNQNKYCSYR
uniref:Odorant receptor n=1 Tax=Protaetia brevitarsis TaxID=348688 RepID=A0A411HR90_PROBE|nr:odorant receptor [Protaetia brevitarsis]